MSSRTAAYYDHLSAWTKAARWFGYGGGHDSQTVHRLLADPKAGGRPTPTRLHDILAVALPAFTSPRVLDAGCGLGGTMIDLAQRWGGAFTGVTLSPSQAALGTAAIGRAGLASRVRIVVGSYDDPPAGPFDCIIAIESLAHSPDPAHSVRRLAAQLDAGGVLAIVDDMPRPDLAADARAQQDLATFKRGWQCPVLFSREQYAGTFTACGLDLVADHDLSDAYTPRPPGRIAQLAALNRLARTVVPLPGWHMVMDSYLGGLALERLYRRQRVAYRLLVGRRPL